MIARSLPRCAFWFCFSAIPLLAAIAFSSNGAAGELPASLVVVGLFGVQGFLAELIGMRADASGASFPRRMFPPLGVPVFWRTRLPAERISRVDPMARREVRVFLTSGDFIDLLLADRRQKEKFLRDVGVSTGRRGRC